MYDLHIHTYWSYDATARPEAYIAAAVERGIRCLAITEHHNVDGLSEVRAAAKGKPLRVIPAAELTVTTSVGSIDLLCYNLPVTPAPELSAVYDSYHQWQQEYGAGAVNAMRKLGFDYTHAQWVELLQSYRPSKTLAAQGNTHVQNDFQRDYFICRGFIPNAEAYQPLIQSLRQTGLLPPYPSVKPVTSAVKNAGALIVIAHPRGYFLNDDSARMDLLRKECALDGIECAHPDVPPEFGRIYRRYCLDHNLLSTAGSDTHIESDIPKCLGQFGQEQWLDELLDRLG